MKIRKRTIRRYLAMFLVLVLCMGMSLSAFADDISAVENGSQADATEGQDEGAGDITDIDSTDKPDGGADDDADTPSDTEDTSDDKDADGGDDSSDDSGNEPDTEDTGDNDGQPDTDDSDDNDSQPDTDNPDDNDGQPDTDTTDDNDGEKDTENVYSLRFSVEGSGTIEIVVNGEAVDTSADIKDLDRESEFTFSLNPGEDTEVQSVSASGAEIATLDSGYTIKNVTADEVVVQVETAVKEPVADKVPEAVQAFLDAVAALPSADKVNAENAEAIGNQVNALLDMWEALDESLSGREDVSAALEKVYAVYEAVLAAEEIEEAVHFLESIPGYTPADRFYYNGKEVAQLYVGTYANNPVYSYTNPATAIVIKVGETGYDQRLYTKSATCYCGNVLVEETPDAETAEYQAGNPVDLEWREGLGSAENPVSKTLYAVWEKDDENQDTTYTVIREYYVDYVDEENPGEKVARVTSAKTSGIVGEEIDGAVLASNNPNWSKYTIDGETLDFTYKDSNPEKLVLVKDETENVITLRYVIEKEPEEETTYTVVREYYVDEGNSEQKVATVTGAKTSGTVGEEIDGAVLASNNPNWSKYTIDGETFDFTYKDSNPEKLVLVKDETENVITLKYVIKKEPEPIQTPTPAPTEEPTPTEAPTPTEEPTPTEAPTPTEEPTPTEAPTPSETPTPTEAPTPTEEPMPTEVPAPTEEPTPTEAPTTPPVTPTETPEPPTPTATPEVPTPPAPQEPEPPAEPEEPEPPTPPTPPTRVIEVVPEVPEVVTPDGPDTLVVIPDEDVARAVVYERVVNPVTEETTYELNEEIPVLEEVPETVTIDSPDTVIILDEEVPQAYVKTQDPVTDDFVYIPEEEVPLASIGTPQTGDATGNHWMMLFMMSLGGMIFLLPDVIHRKKNR